MINKALLISTLTLLINCNNTKKVSTTTPPVEDDIICTMQFAFVNVEITGNNTSLDQIYLLNNQTQEIRVLLDHPLIIKDSQSYTLIDDSSQRALKNKNTTYTLIGKNKNNKIFSEDYILSADACHVFKVSGKETITLN